VSEYATEGDPGTPADEPNADEGKEPFPQAPAEEPSDAPGQQQLGPDEQRNPATG
jgi:hypothetical protein